MKHLIALAGKVKNAPNRSDFIGAANALAEAVLSEKLEEKDLSKFGFHLKSVSAIETKMSSRPVVVEVARSPWSAVENTETLDVTLTYEKNTTNVDEWNGLTKAEKDYYLKQIFLQS